MLDLDIDWNHVVSTVSGGSLVVAFCRAVISKLLKDFGEHKNQIVDLLQKLSAVNVKLEILGQIQDRVIEHDRKISKIEGILDGATSRSYRPNK